MPWGSAERRPRPERQGAVGTVEAAWLPLAAGTLPVPRLRLRGVGQRDLFDVGAGHDFVLVAAGAPFSGVPL
jgi:hypothetical protein